MLVVHMTLEVPLVRTWHCRRWVMAAVREIDVVVMRSITVSC